MDSAETVKVVSIMKAIRNEEEAVSPVIGVILMVAIVVILAAVIAAFVFGMAGTTSTTKNVAVTVAQNATDVGVITIQGGADLNKVTLMEYSINGGTFGWVTDASGTGKSAPCTVGQIVYTSNSTSGVGTSIDNARLVIKTEFDDGTEQVIFDRQF